MSWSGDPPGDKPYFLPEDDDRKPSDPCFNCGGKADLINGGAPECRECYDGDAKFSDSPDYNKPTEEG